MLACLQIKSILTIIISEFLSTGSEYEKKYVCIFLRYVCVNMVKVVKTVSMVQRLILRCIGYESVWRLHCVVDTSI